MRVFYLYRGSVQASTRPLKQAFSCMWILNSKHSRLQANSSSNREPSTLLIRGFGNPSVIPAVEAFGYNPNNGKRNREDKRKCHGIIRIFVTPNPFNENPTTVYDSCKKHGVLTLGLGSPNSQSPRRTLNPSRTPNPKQ